MESTTKTPRNRSKNFESSEITLLTELVKQNITLINEKFKSSNSSSSVTNEKKRLVLEHITERVNALGVCPRSTKEIKNKWSNLHQKAKKAYTEKARDHQRTGGGPPPKSLSATTEQIVEIYKDCPSFIGLQGVESSIEEESCSAHTMSAIFWQGQDIVEIIGSPNSLHLLSEFVNQDSAAVPVPDAANPGISSSVILQDGQNCTAPMSATEDVQIIDLHLSSAKSKTAKRKIKPEDVTRMQYEVLVEQKKKLIQQTIYYELMNKKLKLHLDVED